MVLKIQVHQPGVNLLFLVLKTKAIVLTRAASTAAQEILLNLQAVLAARLMAVRMKARTMVATATARTGATRAQVTKADTKATKPADHHLTLVKVTKVLMDKATSRTGVAVTRVMARV